MKIFNDKIWRGLTGLLIFLFSTVIFLSVLAFERDGDVNTFLNIQIPHNEVSDDTNYYPSDFRNEDGTFNINKLNEQIALHNIKTQTEGTILVKNANNALPLNPNEREVTLFGVGAAMPNYKPNGGGPNNSGFPLWTSGSNPQANSALGLAGFNVNQEVFDALSNSSVSTTSKDRINEVNPDTFYTSNLQATWENDFNDVAIYVMSRYGGEEQELNPSIGSSKTPYLSLWDEEANALKMIKNSGKFTKTIVIVNSGYPIDLGWLNDPQYGVDALLWVGFPGGNGFIAVADILTGKSAPSGAFSNAFPTSSLSAPAMRNFGDFTIQNGLGLYKNKYVVYAEGIYTGYKYYETRYQDQVLGINNAKTATVEHESLNGIGNDSWDYANEMAYPFGYGLSYVDFTQELKSLEWDRSTHKVTAKVEVTNNGPKSGSLYSGKSSTAVQLYVQLPWEQGMAEKSAIQIIDFEKTPLLATGEKHTVNFEVDDYIFATYDEKVVNGADSSLKGGYVFDAGDYYFAIGNDSHDALNNVLAAKGVTNLFSHTGEGVVGDVSKTKKINLQTLDNKTHARSMETGVIVSNRLQDADLNYFIKDKVTYLTRSDWGTYPDTVVDVRASEEMRVLLEGKTYEKPSDAPEFSSFKFGVKNNINFIDMRFVDWDDEVTWNKFLDQLTLGELAQIPGEKMANEAIISVNYPANRSGDGPHGSMNGGKLYVGETVVAASFNKDIIEERGYLMAQEAQVLNLGSVYGPGANLHRTAYSGRNGEYWTEDGVLSYIISSIMVKAMQDNGYLPAIKHFVANDQEVNRHGVATFMTEQTLREGSLKGFEGAFTIGGGLSTMASYNRIGLIPASGHKPIMTDILRGEWGFKGINMTDSSKDSSGYMYTAESVVAGTVQFNNDSGRSAEVRNLMSRDRDGYIVLKIRENAKHFFYAYANSHIANGLDAHSIVEDFVPWWKPAIIAAASSIGALMVAAGAMFVVSAYVIKRKY